ncbi:MAG: glycosyltransferase family 2 protein [Lachnospiraceae bacterium]|jgi:glycosyltransferase involved in cell wall biosynthesis|nr:glycosyltransferase family 2 protein [Lachnospiraceae bacterium]
MDKLYVVMPAYNEADNIRQVISDWYPVVENTGKDSRLVIVDDGSKDDTYKILTEIDEHYPQLISLTKKNSGHGSTILYAYRYALASGADYVFQTDSDGQTMAEYFSPFWEARNDYDMIIGCRIIREDGFFRLVITRVLRVVIWLFFGVRIRDANIAYRLMKASTLREVLAKIPAEFYLSNTLISIGFAKMKKHVKSIPVKVRPRQGGVNSVYAPQIVKIGFRAIKDLYRLRKEFK